MSYMCLHSAQENTPVPHSQFSNSGIPRGLHIEVVASMPREIVAVTSPTHNVVRSSIDASDSTSCRVVLAEGVTHLDKDFVLLVTAKDPHQPRLMVERYAGDDHDDTDNDKGESQTAARYACMVTLAPKFLLENVKSELVFVVDRSGLESIISNVSIYNHLSIYFFFSTGSMSGSRISQAVSAMQLFLRSLPADCYFNIVRLVNKILKSSFLKHKHYLTVVKLLSNFLLPASEARSTQCGHNHKRTAPSRCSMHPML